MLPEFGNQENLCQILSEGLNQQFGAFVLRLVSDLRDTFRIFTFEDFRIFIRASTEVSFI